MAQLKQDWEDFSEVLTQWQAQSGFGEDDAGFITNILQLEDALSPEQYRALLERKAAPQPLLSLHLSMRCPPEIISRDKFMTRALYARSPHLPPIEIDQDVFISHRTEMARSLAQLLEKKYSKPPTHELMPEELVAAFETYIQDAAAELKRPYVIEESIEHMAHNLGIPPEVLEGKEPLPPHINPRLVFDRIAALPDLKKSKIYQTLFDQAFDYFDVSARVYEQWQASGLHFGDLLAFYRQYAELTQEELGMRVDTLQKHIYEYESGKVLPNPKKARELADALGLTAEEKEIFNHAFAQERTARGLQGALPSSRLSEEIAAASIADAPNAFGRLLRAHRLRANLTREELGNGDRIRRYEMAEVVPPIEEAEAMLETLGGGISPEERSDFLATRLRSAQYIPEWKPQPLNDSKAIEETGTAFEAAWEEQSFIAFGLLLKWERLQARLSLQDVANRLHITKTTVGQFEKGTSIPTAERAQELVKALPVPEDRQERFLSVHRQCKAWKEQAHQRALREGWARRDARNREHRR